ncbi:MAG: radical SAM protein [Alphaproteobacteria bacterium]|nr:radical SAM protein [Alphaproteobacteria bacterium]
MTVLLVSTYDLGHQPFALSSLAARLDAVGARVVCTDLAIESLDEAKVRSARVIGVHLAMHTATRIAAEIVPRVRVLNPRAPLVFFGLYAPTNPGLLHDLGAHLAIGGEFEAPFVAFYQRIAAGEVVERDGAVIELGKQDFLVPARHGLPALAHYAKLIDGAGRRHVVAYTEASRGCKHTCRHCPVVPVYGGRFFVVPRDIVLDDIRQQVAAGATHVSFGDPDFLNGPGHALAVARALHDEFPDLTFDAVIKVEHLLQQAAMLLELRRLGCILITTAAEAVDDAILAILAKNHCRADFIRAVALVRAAGITLAPTFVPFTPWTTGAGYRDLLATLVDLDLLDDVAPVQLAIRLLLPRGSLLLNHPAMQASLGAFDGAALSYRWRHPDAAIDALQLEVERLAGEGEESGASRRDIFAAIWRAAHAAGPTVLPPTLATARAPGPRMSEPWFCCAEPTSLQRQRIAL